MSFLSQLGWRYATKSFDTTRKVSDADLGSIIEAIRMTPTSFGLQPYHFYIVSSQDIKDKIQAAAWNQPQIGTCSHLIVFTGRTDLATLKEEFFSGLSGGNPEIRAHLKGYEDMVGWFVEGKTDEKDILAWSGKQTYIAQGFALAAAAELQIDSCAMEGFDPTAVGNILGLPPTQRALVMLPIGYRAVTETLRPKFRFSRESLFTEVK